MNLERAKILVEIRQLKFHFIRKKLFKIQKNCSKKSVEVFIQLYNNQVNVAEQPANEIRSRLMSL